ncbi:MAG: Rieske (2Fe-2S) protein [Betaproteobacteria bacterium]|nr:Rieske (2Fe-2S) protein [Betaproteobacteria bacterium]
MSEVQVAALADIADGDHRIYQIGELEVGLFRQGETIFGWENLCPHAGGPVCQGKIYRRVEEVLGPDQKSLGLRFGPKPQIVCPWHGYEFDVATGCHPGNPAVRLKPVDVTVRDGHIYVRAPN